MKKKTKFNVKKALDRTDLPIIAGFLNPFIVRIAQFFNWLGFSANFTTFLT